jgi:hypothetical protein
MKKTLLPLALCFLFSLQCHSQRWLWAVEGKTESDCWGLAIDGNANAYITGPYYDTARFDTTLLRGSYWQTFLAKFDGSGNVKWGVTSHGLSSSCWSEGIEATCDKSNNVIICGVFGDTVTIGNDTLRSTSNLYVDDLYLAKFNSNGNLTWAWQSTAPSTNSGGSMGLTIATDKFNSIYMAGEYSDTTTFGPYTFNTSMWNNAFLAKFDSNGNVLWVSSSNSPSIYCEACTYGCTVDDSGYIYVTGFFVDTVSFGPYTLTTNQPYSQYTTVAATYLVKYDKMGNVVWAWQSQCGTASSYSIGYSVLTDNTQNVYITGTIYDSVFFGPYRLMGNNTMEDGGDIFLAKFSPNGNLQWVHPSHSDSGGWSGYSLYKDTLNHIYFSGGGENRSRLANVSFGGASFTIPSSCFEPSFIMKLDTSGNSVCTSMITGGGDDMNSIVCNPSGTYVYVSGDLADSTIFTKDTLEGGEEFPFIARWQACECAHGKIIIQSTDTVCSIAGAIQIFPSPPGGKLSGNGVFGSFFYPDSANIGQYNYIHYYFTDSSGCLGTAIDSVYVENCAGVPVIKNNIRVNTFPNPSNGLFTVALRYAELVSASQTIIIYNVLGQPVYSATLKQVQGDNLIDISSQPSGIYFYREITEDGNLLGEGKVVIEK